MQPTKNQIEQILKRVVEQHGSNSAQFLQTQAAMLSGRDENKRQTFLSLLDMLRKTSQAT